MSPSGGDVDTPECIDRVGDDLLPHPPEGRVPQPLLVAAAVSHRGRAASPVVRYISSHGSHWSRAS